MAALRVTPSPPGQDKGEGNRHQHFHAKERLSAGGGESLCPAALHLLLYPASVQPPAAVPPIQPDRAAGLVSHAQLYRPRAGHSFPQQPVHQRVYSASQLQAGHVPAGSKTLLAKEQVRLQDLWMISIPTLATLTMCIHYVFCRPLVQESQQASPEAQHPNN